ncbi:MAG: VCBS repeat-containing protein, partial [Planctomycetales bacterium]|nr:VCBS repeat-containing protein [Planctomycetales bacterium]
GDVNGDGLDDIYFCQPAALPNRLFVRQSDGSMKDVAAESGVDWLDSTRAALFVDLDNDGDKDLVETHTTTVVVQENDGTGKFIFRLELPTISRLFSLNALDYDNDGAVDLFVCGYSSAADSRPEDVFVSPMPYHDANNGGPNYLFRNAGRWKFTDVTKQVGLDENNLRFSLASSWDDYDNDGDLDLYVANDFGRNNLYRNDDGHFQDIAEQAGVEDIGPGMSATWDDFNNDGFVDLYVSNMFSSAGSRITNNQLFKPGVDPTDLEGFKRHARGNSLFVNRAGQGFEDNSVSLNVTMGRWAWGSLFVDVNNDGWRDIYVANGFVTADNNNDL